MMNTAPNNAFMGVTMYRESKAAYAYPQYGHDTATRHPLLGGSTVWLAAVALMIALL